MPELLHTGIHACAYDGHLTLFMEALKRINNEGGTWIDLNAEADIWYLRTKPLTLKTGAKKRFTHAQMAEWLTLKNFYETVQPSKNYSIIQRQFMTCAIAFEIQYLHEPTDATLTEPGNKAWLTYLPHYPHCHHIALPYVTSFGHMPAKVWKEGNLDCVCGSVVHDYYRRVERTRTM